MLFAKVFICALFSAAAVSATSRIELTPGHRFEKRVKACKKKSNDQSSLTLDKSLIQTNAFVNGLAANGTEAGQVASAISRNNFINFCSTKKLPITNGLQIKTGSCNPTTMGVIPSSDKMTSAKFTLPKNFAKASPPFKDFNVTLAIKNLETGFFVNPNTNYFIAPQDVNKSGVVKGHSHITIEKVNGFQDTTVPDPLKFVFFKGLNAPAKNGKISVTVTGGLPRGHYKVSSINTAANHQPVLGPVAQHGSFDDAIYFSIE